MKTLTKAATLLLSTAVFAAPSMAQSSQTVTLYTDCEFTGKSATFNIGDYRITDMHKKGLLNDVVSSIKVGRGAQVQIYKHDKFSGNTLTLTEDNRCLKGTGLNDDISSFRVTRTQSRPNRPGNKRASVVAFNGGKYERTGNKIWTEYDSYGRTIASYEQLSRRGQRVFLYDDKNEELIEIDRRDGTVRIGPFGENNPVRHRIETHNLSGSNSSGGSGIFGGSNSSGGSTSSGNDFIDLIFGGGTAADSFTEYGVNAQNVHRVAFRDSDSNQQGEFERQSQNSKNWDYKDSRGTVLETCEETRRSGGAFALNCRSSSMYLDVDLSDKTIYVTRRNGQRDEVAEILNTYRLR